MFKFITHSCALLLLTTALGARPAAAAAPPVAASAQKIADLLRSYQVRPLIPASGAPDFSLTDLGGGEVKLSHLGGRWVLLTFFATWCGPCASEMPALQALHAANSQRGFEVLGVALEHESSKVSAWTQQRGVAFTVLLDKAGEVGELYHASNIPLSYLINPRGQVVGMATGARDWGKAQSLVDQLLAIEPPGVAEAPQFAAADKSLELATPITPPKGAVTLSGVRQMADNSSSVAAGEPFALDVHVEWAGTLQDYVLLPPEVTLPDGVQQRGISASTDSSEGMAKVTYHIALRAERPGSYALDPVQLRYAEANEKAPSTQRIEGPTVTVTAPLLLGFARERLAGSVAGLLLLLLAGWALVRWRKQRGIAQPSAAQIARAHASNLEAHMQRARAARADGEAVVFLEQAAEVFRLAGTPPPADLAGMLDEARYGGKRPPAHLLEQIERQALRDVVKKSRAADEATQSPIPFTQDP